jgi:hypothetical protein
MGKRTVIASDGDRRRGSRCGELSKTESRKFLLESIASVRAMKTIASLIPNNELELNVLNSLEERYQAFLDSGMPLRTSLTTGLRVTLLDLQNTQNEKKRRSMFMASRQE